MSHHADMPRIGTFEAWREAARAFLSNSVPPRDVTWSFDGEGRPIFAGAPPPETTGCPTVPKGFLSLANSVVWHSDPQRFARLYAFLWRVRENRQVLADPSDPELVTLRRMEKNVHRCQHKMKAFLRFREITEKGGPRRRFAAWFEPTHHTLEPTAPFFARRFGDMDWHIVTPGCSAFFEGGRLRFGPGQPKPPLPEDAADALWRTYYCSTFNPARLKLRAMRSEMPQKYWKNMPETQAIPGLIRAAERRARDMADAAPTKPPVYAGKAKAQLAAHVSAWSGPAEGLAAAIAACARCPLHGPATQAVPGEGRHDARLMLVGEQPGDHEDLAGRPFVGPAGQLLDRAMAAAGIDRKDVYLTNAVKHFRFTPRGKRRIHSRPDSGHVEQCKWWLEAERQLVRPELVVALGATAAQALTGSGKDILARRGGIETTPDDQRVLITIHPSYLLRLPGSEEAQRMAGLFQQDLARAAAEAELCDQVLNRKCSTSPSLTT